jgi:CRP-like cAMP-binding protein
MAAVAYENALLRSLSPEDKDRLRPHLHLIDLSLGDILYDVENPITWVYFPESGLLSHVTLMHSGAEIETSIVGREGAVGFIEALGSEMMLSRVAVLVPGRAFRVLRRYYQEAFESSAMMRRAVHCRTELLMAESRQSIACHALHGIENRLAAWLLECQNLSGGQAVLPLSQELLALMLGVSRPSISTAARHAQTRGWIRYSRGILTILDRRGLEVEACECHLALQQLRQQLEPKASRSTPGN